MKVDTPVPSLTKRILDTFGVPLAQLEPVDADDETEEIILLDQIEETTETDDQVSVDDILDLVGRRSFGPLLLLAGVITLLPIVGDIPGVPTLMATLVILIAVQREPRRCGPHGLWAGPHRPGRPLGRHRVRVHGCHRRPSRVPLPVSVGGLKARASSQGFRLPSERPRIRPGSSGKVPLSRGKLNIPASEGLTDACGHCLKSQPNVCRFDDAPVPCIRQRFGRPLSVLPSTDPNFHGNCFCFRGRIRH